ncbi:hypothetical protein WAE61_10605 [Comamonadaceae bacterium PP-2]
MLKSYDRANIRSVQHRGAQAILIGRWLNGKTAPEAVRIYLVPTSGTGDLEFLEEHQGQWDDWRQAVASGEKRAREVIDDIHRHQPPNSAA